MYKITGKNSLKIKKTAFLLIVVGISIIFSGCRDGGKELRGVLRSAAESGNKSKKVKSDSKEQTITNVAHTKPGSISACPEGATLHGAPPPEDNEQWCETTNKDGITVKHGQLKKWNSNGKLKIEANYYFGELHGRMITYTKEGNILEDANYFDGQKNGAWVLYNKRGKKISEGNFSSGMKNGKFRTWDKDGDLIEEGAYLSDLKTGVWNYYNRNGEIRSRVTYKADLKEGKTEEYGKGGILLAQGYYKNDVPHGQWVFYDRYGQRQSQGSFLNGKRHGAWTEFAKDGSANAYVVYNNGTAVQTSEQYAKAYKRPRVLREKSFGNGDILGSQPPIRRKHSPIVEFQEENQGPRPMDQGNGWKPM